MGERRAAERASAPGARARPPPTVDGQATSCEAARHGWHGGESHRSGKAKMSVSNESTEKQRALSASEEEDVDLAGVELQGVARVLVRGRLVRAALRRARQTAWLGRRSAERPR